MNLGPPRLLRLALLGGALALLGAGRAADAADAAHSTDAAPRTITLEDALAYAHAHQPDLRAALARVDAARAGADATRARWYPTLTGAAELAAGSTNNSTGSYLAVPGIDNPRVSATRADNVSSSSLVPAATSLVALGLRQEVYDFGRISARATADDMRADVARFSATGEKLVVDYHIEESYFAVYAAKAVVRASSNATERARTHRDQARAGFEAGLRRPIELTRAEAVLDRYELARIRARRDVTVAQSILAAAVGVSDRLLDITDKPPTLAELPSLEAAFDAATTRNPDLAAALARIRTQEKETRAIASETRPNLMFSAAVSGNAGGASPSSGDSAQGAGLIPLVPNWDVGLVLAWPLLDETVKERARQSRLLEETERDEAESVRQRLRASVEQAYTEVEAARDALPVLQRALDAAVANYDQANARFNAGLGNSVELADAEELRVEAEIELAEGTFDLARTRATLGRFIAEAA
jgi:outer membrane protein